MTVRTFRHILNLYYKYKEEQAPAVLLLYASTTGNTAQYAERVAGVLRGEQAVCIIACVRVRMLVCC